MQKLLILSLTVLFLTSCASSSKLLQEGRYDNAIEKAIKKIGKDPSDHAEIGVLRKASKLADKSDQDAIDELKLSGNPSIWEPVYHHYLQLNHRQEVLSRLPDVILAKINFKFRNYIPEIAQAKRKTADYFDAKGESLLKTGNRYNARSAWEYFQKEARLFPDTPGISKKIYAATQQGKTFVLFKVKNSSHQFLPNSFGRDLNKFNLSILNRQWLQIETQYNGNQVFDYVIVLNIKSIEVSPELIDRQAHVEKKTIEDGWKYVLDARGNVKKDSTGNDIKVKKYRMIRCKVTDVHLTKGAQLSGTLDYFDNHSRRLIKSRLISSQFAFDYRYANIQGNISAASASTLRLFKRGPVPFPTDQQMLYDASHELRNIARANIRQDLRLLR